MNVYLQKYNDEWNSHLLKETKRNFNLDLPVENWFNEEGVDEEEIKKDYLMKLIKKYNEKHKYSNELLKFAEKRVMLFQLDKDWRDHLAAMDTLRGSVNLRAMGEKILSMNTKESHLIILMRCYQIKMKKL